MSGKAGVKHLNWLDRYLEWGEEKGSARRRRRQGQGQEQGEVGKGSTATGRLLHMYICTPYARMQGKRKQQQQ